MHSGICEHGKECQNLWKSRTCLLFHRRWRSVELLCYQKQKGSVKLEELEPPSSISFAGCLPPPRTTKKVGGTTVCTSL